MPESVNKVDCAQQSVIVEAAYDSSDQYAETDLRNFEHNEV